VVSLGNLASYNFDIQQQALSGSLRAALSLAKMYTSTLALKVQRALLPLRLLLAEPAQQWCAVPGWRSRLSSLRQRSWLPSPAKDFAPSPP